MTVLTQLSVGAFAAIWLLQLLGASARLSMAALGSLSVGGLALGASTMHLGRPIHAYRALKMWKRSWLSREVLMFSAFSGMAGLYAVSLLLKQPLSSAMGGLTALLGAGGITASACIYLVPARPAWNSKHTIADFFLTGAILGPFVVGSLQQLAPGPTPMFVLIGSASIVAALAISSVAVRKNAVRDALELRGAHG